MLPLTWRAALDHVRDPALRAALTSLGESMQRDPDRQVTANPDRARASWDALGICEHGAKKPCVRCIEDGRQAKRARRAA